MIASRTAFRISTVAGLLVLSLAALSSMQKPVPVCGELAPGYAPIIAFEMARSIADLYAIFGDTTGACRAAIAAQMDTINWVDVFIYIPTYGSFLVFFFLGMRTSATSLASTALRITTIACVADYAENFCLFKLSAQPVASIWLTLLPWVTEIKWLGLGIAGALGGYLLAERGGAWRFAFVPCALGLAAALITIPATALAGSYLSLAFALGWVVFLAVGIRESIRPGGLAR